MSHNPPLNTHGNSQSAPLYIMDLTFFVDEDDPNREPCQETGNSLCIHEMDFDSPYLFQGMHQDHDIVETTFREGSSDRDTFDSEEEPTPQNSTQRVVRVCVPSDCSEELDQSIGGFSSGNECDDEASDEEMVCGNPDHAPGEEEMQASGSGEEEGQEFYEGAYGVGEYGREGAGEGYEGGNEEATEEREHTEAQGQEEEGDRNYDGISLDDSASDDVLYVPTGPDESSQQSSTTASTVTLAPGSTPASPSLSPPASPSLSPPASPSLSPPASPSLSPPASPSLSPSGSPTLSPNRYSPFYPPAVYTARGPASLNGFSAHHFTLAPSPAVRSGSSVTYCDFFSPGTYEDGHHPLPGENMENPDNYQDPNEIGVISDEEQDENSENAIGSELEDESYDDEVLEDDIQNFLNDNDAENFFHNIDSTGRVTVPPAEPEQHIDDPNHEYIQLQNIYAEDGNEGGTGDELTPERFTCPICCQVHVDRRPTTTRCGHIFCKICIKNCVRIKPECPVCRRVIEYDDLVHLMI